MKDALLEISGKFLMGKKDASFTTGQGDGNGKLEKYIQMMERGRVGLFPARRPGQRAGHRPPHARNAPRGLDCFFDIVLDVWNNNRLIAVTWDYLEIFSYYLTYQGENGTFLRKIPTHGPLFQMNFYKGY